MKSLCRLSLLSLMIVGCSPSFEGIRMRAVSPGIDEAFRKLGAAVDLDGYTRVKSDPSARAFETEWRVLRREERPVDSLEQATGFEEVRLTLRLAPRGKLYDVFLGLFVRSESNHAGRGAPADHPLARKWRKVLGSLLVRESKEED